jgi:hypothetical protein
MIQFLADGIDQLDLALDQLAIEDRNFDRFALLLVDNVVELTLHQFARDRASENEMWGSLREPKYDPKAVEGALGQKFDAKVKLAVKLQLVEPAVGESLLRLHAFRNTAYHRGLRHEGILHSLTVFYFTIACEVLKAYKPRAWSWGSLEAMSHRARKYLGDVHSNGPAEAFPKAYDRLSEVAASLRSALTTDLSADMQSTVDATNDTIQFLADDSPEKMTRDEAIIQSQAWAMAFTQEGKSFARDNGCRESTFAGYVEWLARNFPWSVRVDPVPSWQSRLASLKREKNNHLALKRYSDFMRQTDSIRSTLHEAAVQLDAYIDEQIDRARGK